MIVYFSTVVRAAPQEKGGELVKVDWDTKRVLARTPIVPANPSVLDRNSRGSTRGGRGILVDEDYVYVASYHSILVFDHQLTALVLFRRVQKQRRRKIRAQTKVGSGNLSDGIVDVSAERFAFLIPIE